MSRPLVIFDLDGTLAHTGPDLLATLNRITKQYDIEPMTLETLTYTLGQGAKAMIAKAFERQNKHLPSEVHDRLFEEFLADYEENLCVETHLFDGVLDAIEELDESGFMFAVCTNKSERMAKLLLEELGVSHLFAALTGGDTFDFRKPDARHIVETAKLASGTLEKCIMIGDSKADIGAANNAGIPSIAVTFGYSDMPVENLGASKIIDHFSDLPSAVLKLMPTSS